MTSRQLFIIAGFSGLLCVALGAMGAHGLKDKIEPSQLEIYKTAAHYHFFHTLALFIVGLLIEKNNSALLRASAYTFLIGILLFSGSLYLMSIHQIIGSGELKMLGIITPFGGLSFMLGWLFISISFLKKR